VIKQEQVSPGMRTSALR